MFVRESGMPEVSYWEEVIDHCGLIDEMGLTNETDILEIGVGYGSFLKCFALNKNVRYQGIDLDPEMICHTRERFSSSPASLDFYQGNIFDNAFMSGIENARLVLCFNILHHDNPDEIISICLDKLSAGGKLAIGHWRSDIETPRGPPVEMRLGRQAAEDLLLRYGVNVLSCGNSKSSRHHYYVLGNVPG